jgi:thioredoxin reductase
MIVEQIETVIVGGGQAGLAMSYYLGQLGREHVILERQRVAERTMGLVGFPEPELEHSLARFCLSGRRPRRIRVTR